MLDDQRATCPAELTRAFADFSRHSVSMESAFHALKERVEQVDADLHRANCRLAASLARSRRDRRTLHNLLANLSCGVAILADDGSVRFTNDAARRLARIEGEPAAGRRLPGVLGRTVETLTAGMSGGATTGRHTVTLAGGRGRDRIIEIMVSRTGDELLVLLDDATSRRQLEDKHARATRLEAMGRMAAEVAHEVRNPLGSVELFAGLLAEEVKDDAAQTEMAQMILIGTRSIAAVVGNMLSFARSFPAPRAVVDLGGVAKDAVRLASAVARARGIDLRALTRQAPPLVGDAELLQQIILNLVQNAVDACETGGRVRVRVFAARGGVALSVTDTGCGIADEDIDRIFDPFYTARPGGTGLGLAVVHRQVEHHGGRIDVRSRPGRGSRFLVIFPGRSRGCEEAA